MRVIHEQTKTNPVLADKAFVEINAALKRNLTWLDQAFGRSWKIMSETTEGKRISLPCVYTHGNNYEQLVPSADLGCYSFFVLHDPHSMGEYGAVSFNASLILWVDVRKCMATDKENRRDTELIKAQVLHVLMRDNGLKAGSLSVRNVYEEDANVWKGFSLDDTQQRFMTHPFAAFRFDISVTVPQPCNIIM